MKSFMDRDFLLTNDTAKILFHEYSENLPIIDYHCHIDPKEIAENKRFENITRLWLGGDHYKWRLLRAAGVEEKYITGDASDYDKFVKWADVCGRAIGNPLYHWSHLELKKYFGYEGTLSKDTADEVWNLCNEKLQSEDMSALGIIEASNVEVICTTDDPADDLKYHKQIAENSTIKTKVLPAFRPDKAIGIEKKDYSEYLLKLEKAAGVTVNNLQSLKEALVLRLDYFEKNGCKVSDHGLDYVMYEECDENAADVIFKKALSKDEICEKEAMQFKTVMMLFLGREYAKRGWVMQLHYGVRRNNNSSMFAAIGPDTGYDCIGDQVSQAQTIEFLNRLESDNLLPKTILYSLNPNDNTAIDTIIGCFQNSDAYCKIQHGSAWWFNDNIAGMTDQLKSLATIGFLPGFVGMLTDSRSFLSYTRHEYFRRILCNMIGTMVENGEFPDNKNILKQIVQDISYNNAVKYFDFY